MDAITAIFWSSLLAVAYVYVGYPSVLLVWSRLRPRPVHRGAWEPTVSMVIASRGEAAVLADKLDDCLALDYPSDRLHIVVSLDGASEEADRQLAARAGRSIDVVRSLRHEGKAEALNRALQAARGEVVVFCDARQRVDPGAIRALVATLHDAAVGAVSGELLLLDDAGRPSRDGIGLYWRYEKALRAMESRIHSTVGATGALYAVRRSLLTPIPAGAILDDVIVPMRVVLAGWRTVFEPRARAFDRVAPFDQELKRKVRTLAGNFQLVRLMPELLDPFRNPVFVQFVSHKLGRLVVPYLLLAILASSALLGQGIYLAAFGAQVVGYVLAGAGALIHTRAIPAAAPRGTARLVRLLLLPHTFVLLNWAAVQALGSYLAGHGADRLWADGAEGAPQAVTRGAVR